MAATALAYGATPEEVEQTTKAVIMDAATRFHMIGSTATPVRPIKPDEWDWVPSEYRRSSTLVQWIRIDK